MMLKSTTIQKVKKCSATGHFHSERKAIKQLPDLSEFRKSIHVKGEPLSQVVIKGRG